MEVGFKLQFMVALLTVVCPVTQSISCIALLQKQLALHLNSQNLLTWLLWWCCQ